MIIRSWSVLVPSPPASHSVVNKWSCLPATFGRDMATRHHSQGQEARPTCPEHDGSHVVFDGAYGEPGHRTPAVPLLTEWAWRTPGAIPSLHQGPPGRRRPPASVRSASELSVDTTDRTRRASTSTPLGPLRRRSWPSGTERRTSQRRGVRGSERNGSRRRRTERSGKPHTASLSSTGSRCSRRLSSPAHEREAWPARSLVIDLMAVPGQGARRGRQTHPWREGRVQHHGGGRLRAGPRSTGASSPAPTASTGEWEPFFTSLPGQPEACRVRRPHRYDEGGPQPLAGDRHY